MNAEERSSEEHRQIVHIAMGSLALLLRYLNGWEAMILAGGAVAINLYALPRIAGTLYRPGETRRRFSSGIVLYPLAVLLLLITCADRLDIVAAAWGVLAFGDGTATLVGRRVRSAPIPWNREKTIAGSAAFVVFGGAAGAFLCWWCRPVVVPPPFLWFSIGMPWVAALVASAVETIPIRLNDNLSVPASAGLVLWLTSLISQDLVIREAQRAAALLPFALLANAVVATLGYAARTVTLSGTIAGVIIGTVIAITGGWGAWALLVATFGCAILSSRLGLHRKTLLGIAEARGGRRGAGNAFANTGVAASAAVLGVLTYAHDAARLALVAALAAGGSDTVASEIGKAWGRRTILLPSLQPVPPGTSGAISAEGTAAGLIGALALSTLGAAVGLISFSAVPAVVVAATIGSFAESLLGSTFEAPGVLNNDVLNFLNTTIAAAAALALVQALP